MKKQKNNLASLKNGEFLVSALGIVFNPTEKKILIVRRERDLNVKKLRWCFPGGNPEYGRDLEKSFESLIKKKTGIEIKNLGCIFSRIPKENPKILLLYYLCEETGGKLKTSESFKEFKWVRPNEVQKYFTTSFDKRLKEYILGLK